MNKTDELLLENQELEVRERKVQLAFTERMVEVSLYGDKMEQVRRGIEACLQILRIDNRAISGSEEQVPKEIRLLASTKIKEFLTELKPYKA